LSSTARSKKTKTKNKQQTYTVTLELMTPVQCTFKVEAGSPGEAVDIAMCLDWEEYVNVGPSGDGPTYCTEILDESGNGIRIPKKYTYTEVNKENN
jgi:hypothetical protein